MGGGSKNLDDSPILVDDQQQQQDSLVMTTSNSTIINNEPEKRQYTWEEIRRHSNKKDRWIVIDNHVYDITNWVKHPGGQTLLNYAAGQDASVSQKYIHSTRNK